MSLKKGDFGHRAHTVSKATSIAKVKSWFSRTETPWEQ